MMIYHHKNLTRSFASVALAATLLTGAAPVFAQTTTSQSHTGFFQSLIQFIEQKFGLDQNQVQSAVQQYQQQRQATITPHPTLTQQQMSDNEKSRLDKLVSSGKITSDQETAILNELSSVQSKYNLSALSGDQRKTQAQAMMNELKSWAQSNNINSMYVMPFGGGGMRNGHRMMQGGHIWGNWKNAPTPTPGS